MISKTKLICIKNPPQCINNPLYIGRGSYWGNPFVIGKDGTRQQVVEKFRRHLWKRKDMMAKLPELVGKTMMCFCEPNQACHGDILMSALDWYLENNGKPVIQPSRDQLIDRNIAAGLELGAIPI